jgi:spermidine synthase
MISIYLRLVRRTLYLCLLLPIVVIVGSRMQGMMNPWYQMNPWNRLPGSLTIGFLAKFGLVIAAAVVCGIVIQRLLKRLAPSIEELSADTGKLLDRMSDRWLPWAIAASAFGSLALELAVIRWQSTVWEIFAFYKNFSLLSCFAGLGLGYALAKHERVPAVAVIPLLAVQMVALIGLRHGINAWNYSSLMATPIKEQLNMGLGVANNIPHLVVVYFFLGTVMLLTALTFLPVGQICGRLLERTAQLRAYGFNLAGSIAGTFLLIVVSFFWTPPVIWFVPCFAVLILLQLGSRKALIAGVMAILAVVAVLNWPVSSLEQSVYSPYQLLERGPGERGLMVIRAAGHFYQRVYDLSTVSVAAYSDRKYLADCYELPYRLHPGANRVAIVGAGTGNDVAAALRRGVTHVDAIEIDPAILKMGAFYHPEQPYSDIRVTPIINDARAFLRSTKNHYDLIIYGLLDSHTLLSHASNLRLDSYVYTVEGLRDARNQLADGGVVSLSFAVMSPEIGRKIYLMMKEAFDGHPPVCIQTVHSGPIIFAQSKSGNFVLGPEFLRQTEGFTDVSSVYADPKLRADISTDDWPFFYMPQRVYPMSYIWMVAIVLLLSVFLFRNFIGERLRFSHAAYFFMGVGFMLIETKGITELGLMYGNTWQVIGIVITAILVMAYLANLTVMKLGFRRPLVPFILLLLSLGIGLTVAKVGGLPATSLGQLTAIVVLTCPMFFSGIAFSSLLAGGGNIAGALSMNLLGAMCGGLLEYNSMYFGFQSLYWIAMGTYAAAFGSYLLVRRAA